MKHVRFGSNKLVRDKTPERLNARGLREQSRILDKEEYLIELKKKLLEEVQEVIAEQDREAIVRECADVLEVIHALAKAIGGSIEDVEQQRIERKNARGGFESRLYQQWFEVIADSDECQHLLEKEQHRYPKIKEI